MTVEAPYRPEYVTTSEAGHVFEDELANNPPRGEPFDWYEPALRATIDGELAAAGSLPGPAALARAITANYAYIFKSLERPTPLAIAEQLLIALQNEARTSRRG